MFRNVTLHDAHTGYLADCCCQEILKEIDELVNMDPANLPEARRYLLEMDFTSLRDFPSMPSLIGSWPRARQSRLGAGDSHDLLLGPDGTGELRMAGLPSARAGGGESSVICPQQPFGSG